MPIVIVFYLLALTLFDIVDNVTVSESPAYLKNYLYLLLLGQALNGFTGASLFTLGITYIDQSCTTEVTSWFIGENWLYVWGAFKAPLLQVQSNDTVELYLAFSFTV